MKMLSNVEYFNMLLGAGGGAGELQHPKEKVVLKKWKKNFLVKFALLSLQGISVFLKRNI